MKVAIITGGNRGVGKSAALHAARRGTGIILTYRSHADEAAAVVAEIEAGGGKAVALQLDAGEVASFEGFTTLLGHTLREKWGRESFDFLVNNAGIAQRTLIKDTTEEQFDQLTNVHFKGPFFLTQKLIPMMEDGGLVLNVSSGLTRFTNPAGVATYAALKGAMEIFTKYIVREYASRQIRANIVAPGALDTQFAGPDGREAKQKEMIGQHTALGRCGEAEDIGPLIASLLSDDWRWVNGQRIEATGGVLI